ncbi:transcription termination/antitermination NusG family protein [Yokenella regensburgei]|uniref:transcription termination/antitermination NusG family protein n=1 Tax=Yokenella regensburgei TaxID=158877 RepID=UPI0031DA2709
MENWYLACHKTGKHNAFKAQMFLAQPRIDAIVFIPQICSYQPRSDRPGQFRKLIEPLFPGYMFICFDPEITHTSKISSCPGVSHLVRFADKILPVHDRIVEEIMHLPVCTHIPALRERKVRAPAKPHPELTTAQHETLMKVVAEKDGLTRSTKLYAFAQSVSGAFPAAR